MGRQGEETDIDYILSHLQDPAGLLDPEFLVWLQVPVHRKLFEEIRNQQEAFMRFSMEDSIDVDREYERLQAKIRFFIFIVRNLSGLLLLFICHLPAAMHFFTSVLSDVPWDFHPQTQTGTFQKH